MNLSGITLAVCGEIGQAQTIADEIATRKSRDVTSISVLSETRPAIEISRNNPDKAVEILESTRILERGFGIPGRATYLRGIAYLRQKAGTEAINEFQKILDRRGQFDTSPFFPLAHLGLARARRTRGRYNERRAYQDFFALWKDADADIPILIEARQEYGKLKCELTICPLSRWFVSPSTRQIRAEELQSAPAPTGRGVRWTSPQKNQSIKGPISVPVSPPNAVKCYPCR